MLKSKASSRAIVERKYTRLTRNGVRTNSMSYTTGCRRSRIFTLSLALVASPILVKSVRRKTTQRVRRMKQRGS